MADASLQGKLIEFKGASLAVMTAYVRETDAVRLADALHMMLGGMPDFFAGEPTMCSISPSSATRPTGWTGPPCISLLRRYQLQPSGRAQARRTTSSKAPAAPAWPCLVAESFSAERPVAAAQPRTPPARPCTGPHPGPGTWLRATCRSGTAGRLPQQPSDNGRRPHAGRRPAAALRATGLCQGRRPGPPGRHEPRLRNHCRRQHPLLRPAARPCAGRRPRATPSARIFSTNFSPELVSIAGVYRTFERGIPQTVAGRGAQVRLTGSDNLHTLEITPLQYD
jgi:septum site-determining protein MinC